MTFVGIITIHVAVVVVVVGCDNAIVIILLGECGDGGNRTRDMI